MAVPLTTDQRAALHSSAVKIRLLVDLYLDSGRQSYWDDDSNETFNTVLYYGVAAFASASAVSLGVDLGAEGIELRLDLTRLLLAADDPSDPANILGQIESEPYQQRRIELRYAIFNAETNALVMTLRRFTGLIDQIEMAEESGEGEAQRAVLIVRCESIARRYGRRGGRRRTDVDQQDIWPGDTFFQWVSSTVNQERNLFWGKDPPNSPAAPQGILQRFISQSGGIFGRH